MKALSIRQPWAWLIMRGGKDIENRTWPTKVRGRVLIHAAKGMTCAEYEATQQHGVMPYLQDMKRGGIVGSVEIVDCVQRSNSCWFEGLYGFVLRDPKHLPFFPMKGRLGFFEVAQPCACRVTDLDGVCVECGQKVTA